jgi:hypothetical protein
LVGDGPGAAPVIPTDNLTCSCLIRKRKKKRKKKNSGGGGGRERNLRGCVYPPDGRAALPELDGTSIFFFFSFFHQQRKLRAEFSLFPWQQHAHRRRRRKKKTWG